MNNIFNNSHKKLNEYQKKLSVIESKYLAQILPKINFDILNHVKKKINEYETIIKLLYSNPQFYLELKYIQLDFTREPNEFDYIEIIWSLQHYEFIEEIKSTANDIINLIKFAVKYNIISYIQFIYLKKTLQKINKVFDYDKCFEKLYNLDIDIKFFIKLEEIELFFNLLQIACEKIYFMKKSHKSIKYNICNVSNNHKYINLIKKIKSKL